MVPAVEPEVRQRRGEDAGGDAGRQDVDEEGRDHGDHAEHQADSGGDDAARGSVGALQVGLATPQHDVAEVQQHVGGRRTEDGDVDQQGAGVGPHVGFKDAGEQEADGAGHQ